MPLNCELIKSDLAKLRKRDWVWTGFGLVLLVAMVTGMIVVYAIEQGWF